MIIEVFWYAYENSELTECVVLLRPYVNMYSS